MSHVTTAAVSEAAGRSDLEHDWLLGWVALRCEHQMAHETLEQAQHLRYTAEHERVLDQRARRAFRRRTAAARREGTAQMAALLAEVAPCPVCVTGSIHTAPSERSPCGRCCR